MMRLPWVSRTAYSLLHHNYDQLQRMAHEHQDERYDRLLEKYHELAMSKSAPTETPSLIAPLADMPTRVESVIAQAIKDESQGDGKLARYMWKRARELKNENMRPEEIATELRKWQTTEVKDE